MLGLTVRAGVAQSRIGPPVATSAAALRSVWRPSCRGGILQRLKILPKEKAVVLPGCILAAYDLFGGTTRALWFHADAAASESKRAEIALQ